MTGNSADFSAFILEQLQESIPVLRSKPFFGGTGLTTHGLQFAMLMGNTVYFVVDDTTRPTYESLGSVCFSYKTAKKTVNVKKYSSVPAHIIEEQDELIVWARRSIKIATQADKRKAAP